MKSIVLKCDRATIVDSGDTTYGLAGFFPLPLPLVQFSKDQFSNSSKPNEKMLGLGWVTASKIVKWVWQPNCIIILERGFRNSLQSATTGFPDCRVSLERRLQEQKNQLIPKQI